MAKWSTDRQLIIFEHDDDFSRTSQFGWGMKMDSLIDRFQLFNKNNGIKVESLRERIHFYLDDIFAYPLIEKVDKTTKIYIGKEESSDIKKGDIWLQVVE